MLTVEQIAAAQKAQLTALFDLTNQALSSVEKIAELNLQASKTSLEEGAEKANALLSVKDVQDLLALQISFLQPVAEKAASYSRHLFEIASGAGADVTKAAEAQAAAAQKQFVSALEAALKNAPQGSEAAVAAVKNAIATANNAMETVQNAVKQATEAAEANMAAATNNVLKTAKSAKTSKGGRGA